MTGGVPHDLTDEQLIERAVRDPQGRPGREAASELLQRHRRRVYLWCYRYVHEPERAMDLAQEALLSAYRALPSFQGRSRFSSWLFVITRNCCLKAVAAPSLVRDDAELEGLPDPAGTPETLFEASQDEERLRRLLMQHLDEDERRALWLRCFERMPVDEISRVMQLENVTGARGLLQRARRKLRSALDRTDA
jgi:RNA polymerase sigma-70 factor (ECF subfamily)